jgi:uncharacterized repeat protein (TIGR02543 family)
MKWYLKIVAVAVTISITAFMSCSKDDDSVSYTVTFDAVGGSPVPSVQQVEAGGTATAPSTNPTKLSYVFLFWYLNGASTAYNFSTPVNSNITLQAKWEEENKVEYWQVAWELNGGAWPSSGGNHATQVVKGGTLAEPNVPIKTGSTFDGWYKEASLTNKVIFPYSVSGVTANFTLYAKWTTISSSTTDVYSAGYYVNSNNIEVACYWKNTTRYDLTDGTSDAQALDITVVSDIIYTAGYYRNGTTLIPCYWINSQKYDLCASPDYGEAMTIKVYDGKVYTAGYCNTANNNKNACYWVNQERHDIYTINTTYSTRNNIVRDIALIDNVVYTCGTYHNGYNTLACFWVGSTKYNLQGSNYNSYAYSMYYSGSKFYIAGSYSSGKPCYFTAELNGNNSLSHLNSNQTGGYAYAKDICVSNNITYTVGYRGSTSSDNNALFWKNNVVEQIIGSDYNSATAKSYTAESICLSNNVLYIAGNNHNSAACYWKRNTNGTSFSETILHEKGRASAIFVK